MGSLKAFDLRLLSELIKNCRRSDRNLAKTLGTSQPTVTRRRTKLEREGLIQYTGMPNFAKLGFEIMAFSFYSWHPEATQEATQNSEAVMARLLAFLGEHKNIIFTSYGQGFGMDRMMISVHKSYTDYVKLMNAVKQEWGAQLAKTNSFIVSFREDVKGRDFSFKHFAEALVTAPELR